MAYRYFRCDRCGLTGGSVADLEGESHTTTQPMGRAEVVIHHRQLVESGFDSDLDLLRKMSKEHRLYKRVTCGTFRRVYPFNG